MNTIKNKICVTLIAGSSLLSVTAHTQLVTAGDKRMADAYYAKGDYNAAAQQYEHYFFAKGTSGPAPYVVQKQAGGATAAKAEKEATVLYRLADSYRQLNNYTQAATWYKKLLDEYADQFPVTAHLYYGISLRANGQYATAQQELEKFLQQYKAKDQLFRQATLELNNCAFIRQQLAKQDKVITANRLASPLNKEGASYAAGWLDEQTLLFTSTRTDSGTAQPAHINTLYSATQDGDHFATVAKLPLPAAGEVHQGAAAVTPDGKNLFFTSWSVDKAGKRTAAIYITGKNGDTWSAPVKLGATVNVEGANARQPFVTADGKYLLFSSDKPGGKGGFDIWYAPLKENIPGRAMNAGEVINTKEDEEAPFYHAGDKQLVFASKGRTGMGGFDLYTAKGEVAGAWETPQNMGYPINSIKDDIYFAGKGAHLLDHALISSDRVSACCLELFDIHTARETAPVAAAPMSAPAVTPVQSAPETIVSTSTVAVDTVGIAAFAVRSIRFAFNETKIDPAFYTYLDELAAYLKAHSGFKIEIGAYSDGKGEEAYNLKLSADRAAACAAYLVKAGIAADRIQSKGYGACCPLVKETTPDGKDDTAARSKNRRVEVKVIQ
jgi:outer membrane protein OmpA-like peptidoglycan-associated protein/tetratricopeptide (TPR) repeat protein